MTSNTTQALGLLAATLAGCSTNTSRPYPAEPTFDVVSRSKNCRVQQDSGSLECTYEIGIDLKIGISAIGEEDTGVSFLRSDFNGDYYGSIGLLHGCIVVMPGRKLHPDSGLAFISPSNGKVYRRWQDCRDSR